MGTHPRQRVRTLIVTTPANTAAAAPQSTTWNLGTGVLERLEVVIPDGHAGLTGFRLLWGGRVVMPYEGGEWITGNSDKLTVELGLWTGAGRITVDTYNTDDTFAHGHHLRAFLTELEPSAALGIELLPLAPLAPGGGGGFELPGFDFGEPPPEELPTDDELEAELVAIADDLLAALAGLVDTLGRIEETLAGLVEGQGRTLAALERIRDTLREIRKAQRG